MSKLKSKCCGAKVVKRCLADEIKEAKAGNGIVWVAGQNHECSKCGKPTEVEEKEK